MSIPGDCFASDGLVPITISTIRKDGCELTVKGGWVPDDQRLSIWIGAIGPISARVASVRGSTMAVLFEERLDERIIGTLERLEGRAVDLE